MDIKYSIGFLSASLIQGGLVLILNSLSIGTTYNNSLLYYILTGQVAGYLLLYVIKNIKILAEINDFVIGFIFGILIWTISLPITFMIGTVDITWNFSILSDIITYGIFGIMAQNAIKTYGTKNAETTSK